MNKHTSAFTSTGPRGRVTPWAAALTATVFSTLLPPAVVRAANEIGFIERFALAEDREEALRQLIPGTEEFYSYHALHLQNGGRRAEFRELLDQWAKRSPDSASRQALEARQMLLDYGADPQATLQYLREKLGLTFNHEREVPSAKPNLPVALDPALIAEERFYQTATAGVDHLDHLSERAVARLVASGHAFSPAQRRAALAKLTRPDVAGLVPLIAADLATPESRGFGEFPIHAALTLAQLDELRRLRASQESVDPAARELHRNERFVLTYLGKLQPSADADLDRDPVVREAWLARAWSFVSGLDPAFNSLKAHILYQRLDLARTRGQYDAALFLEYVKLPRQVHYISPVWQRDQQAWAHPADLAADFSAITKRPPIGSDEGLVRDYLLRLLATADSPAIYAPYFEQAWLKAVFAEARLTAGVDDARLAETLASALSSEAYDALKRRVDLDFDLSNPARLAVGDTVSLDVWVKNTPQVTLKIFELNTGACYEATGRPIGTDIDLDGLVAATQRTVDTAAAPLRRIRRTFELPEIAARRGVWVVELIGNGRSSRALIRKGQLQYLTRPSSAGTVVTVFDETRQALPKAFVTFAGRRFDPAANGEIVIPFTAQPGPQPVILQDGAGFASLETITLAGEAYALTAGFHIEREQILAGGQANLAVRPRLELNGQPVSATLVEKPVLTLTSTDHDGISTTVTLVDFKLHDDLESTHGFKVPDRLASLAVSLSGEVRSMTEGKTIPLGASWTWSGNGIDMLPYVSDLHLGRAADGWFLEERGKNGETKPERAVHLIFTHRDYANTVSVSLKTGDNGRLALGALNGIARVVASGPNGLQRDWALPNDTVIASSNVHAAEGEIVRVASFARAADASLLEVRADSGPVADHSAKLADADGFIEARDLAAGDYQLHIRPEGRLVSIRITKGQRVHGFIASPTRLLEAPPALPLHIPVTEVQNDALVIRVANADPLTRVHVAATRFAPERPLAQLGLLTPPGLLAGAPGDSLSQYVSGRQLGDEIRYILERLAAKHFPGVMLPRPGLLLNPWAVRDTVTTKQDAQAGDRFQRLAEAKQAGLTAAPEAAAATAADGAKRDGVEVPATASIDFLASTAPVTFNVKPGENGVIRIPLAGLAGASQVHVLALNGVSSVARTVVLPAQPIVTRDLRLASGLDPQGHFAEQDQTIVLQKDAPHAIPDAISARFETYDHLGRVFTLLRTLSGNATLAEFAFILDWPTFDQKKKLELYSRHACHELAFFLARKDPEFLSAVLQPYLANKKDRTFLDEYLLEIDLARHLEPWRYGRLNTLERLLLGRRLPGQMDAESRALADWLALTPVNREEDRRRLDTALRGFALAQEEKSLAKGKTAGRAMGESGVEQEELSRARGALGRFRKELGDVDSLAMNGALAGAPGAPPAPAAAFFADDSVASLELAELQVEASGGLGGSGPVSGKDAELLSGLASRMNADKQLRGLNRAESFYRVLGVTQEWAENNYWKLLIGQQDASLVQPNRFWQDYAKWSGQGSFVSAHVAEVTRNFSEMMLALAVLDLPFPSQAQQIEADVAANGVLTITPKTPTILFHQAVKPAPVDETGASLLVSQNFYRVDDRYIPQPDGEKVDKFITGEFLTGVLYGAQVVVTNPTSSTQKLDVLFQIPRGARPAAGAKVTRSVPLRLEPFRTHTMDIAFYFPKAGSFVHFPVHVARGGKVVAFAPATSFTVVDEPSAADTTSWAYVSQNGTDAEVFAFLDAANLRTLDLDRIAWRVRQSPDFFRNLVARLAQRRVWHPTTYAYALVHNDVSAIREFLRHDGRVLAQAGPWLRSPLVDIDPVERLTYEQLEYSPLVNARAHRLGPERTILNDRFREQYQRFMAILAHRPALDDADRLALTAYLLLQDRVEEALAAFSKVNKPGVHTLVQYDYTAAWLALAQGDPATARTLAAARANEPVDHWRQKFAQLLAQLDEVDGKVPAEAKPEDRDLSQEALAAAQPRFGFKLDGTRLVLDTWNLSEVTVNYYLMDLEFLFSTNPFVGQDSSRFAQIIPNASETRRPANAKSSVEEIALPREFQNRNVLVEIVAAGQRRAQAVYANELKVSVSENFGHLQVRHARDDRPLPRTYVKVYAEVDGRAAFYKDGYTDLRGRFDYASLSTDDLNGATRFAVLILSDEHGALVKEAPPPRR
ncbi:MAG: hypothetical protein ACKV19_17985 [Verrucomicrobiales bacterium]